jgi:hypothetical protein
MPKRYDRAHRLDKAEKTPQGFLKFPLSRLTRTGVFAYRDSNGKPRYELRHPDDVFDADSLATLSAAPVTDDHPKEMVNPANASKYTKGWLSDGVKVGSNKYVESSVVLADADVIKKAEEDGKEELSCGYTCDLEDESGEFEGQKYDVRQRNIRYNHVALVKAGRAGPEVRLRMDSEAFEIQDNPTQEETKVEKIMIDGVEYEVAAAVAMAYKAYIEKLKGQVAEDAKKDMVPKAEAEKAAGAVTEVQKSLDAEKAKSTTLQAKVDALEEEKKARKDASADTVIQAAVEKRRSIDRVAASILGDEEASKLDSKNDLEVMKAVVLKHSPAAKLDGKDELYIQTRFDGISEDLEGRSEREQALAKKNAPRGDEKADLDKARDKQREDGLKDWEKPLSVTKA